MNILITENFRQFWKL